MSQPICAKTHTRAHTCTHMPLLNPFVNKLQKEHLLSDLIPGSNGTSCHVALPSHSHPALAWTADGKVTHYFSLKKKNKQNKRTFPLGQQENQPKFIQAGKSRKGCLGIFLMASQQMRQRREKREQTSKESFLGKTVLPNCNRKECRCVIKGMSFIIVL